MWRINLLTGLLWALTLGVASHAASCDRASPQRETPMATLKGTVASVDGKSLSDVSVVIEGPAGGDKALTDDSGGYEVKLTPASYRVAVEQAGFRPFRSDSFRLEPGATKTLDVRLDPVPGAAADTSPTPPSPPAADSADAVEIDFGRCAPERRRIDVTYGSTTYEVVGRSGDDCVMKYGHENESPGGSGTLNKTCAVPVSLGKQRFKKTDVAVDFSPLKAYCKSSDGSGAEFQ